MITSCAKAGFWGSLILALYVVVVFPVIVVARAASRRCPVPDTGPLVPLTVVLAAHQEAAVIAAKVRNTACLDYPRELLDMVVVCDGCTDDTASLARAAAAQSGLSVTIVEVPRGGKNAALRVGLARASGAVVLLTDADAMLRPDAARRLVASLEGDVGGACGRVAFGQDGSGRGERTHWAVEDALRRAQTASGSMTSAVGPIYAIRRELVEPPPDGVTDDFWISAHVPLRGGRLVFVPDAVADLPPPADGRGEFRRKVRIISAGLRAVWCARHEFRLRWIDVQVLTHKVLRRLLPIPAISAMVTALILRRHGGVYRMVALLSSMAVAAATAGWTLRDTRVGRHPLLALPAFGATVAIASVAALRDLARKVRHDIWETP